MLPWGQPADISEVPPAARYVAQRLEDVRALGSCDGTAIFWFSDTSLVLVPLVLAGILKPLRAPVIHPHQGSVGIAFARAEAAYIERDYARSGYAHALLVELGIEAAFAIPLEYEGRTRGMMCGVWTAPHEQPLDLRASFEAIARDIAQSFGILGAVFVEAQVNRAESSLVSSLIREYASDGDLGATCARVAAAATTLLGCDYAIISRDEPDLSHSYHGAHATKSDAWAQAQPSRTAFTQETDDSLDAGETVIAGTQAIGLAEAGFEQSRSEGARTVMLSPIAIDTHRIGVLIVGWRLEIEIAPHLREVAKTLAGHAAIAIGESQRQHVHARAPIERRIDDSTARRLMAALASGEIGLEYQPIIAARTRKVAMFEALSRWPGAPPGYERPDRFIVFAEDRGLIGALTDYVIALAATDWRHVEPSGASLAINVSMRNFEDPAFAERTLDVLARHGIPADRFTIELTETSQMIDRHIAVATARRFVEAGIALTIDDFGEGFAALSYLKTFRASALKIDRRYVTNVATDAYDFSIVRSVTELAHTLGLEVVAEGIETPEALDIVSALGCDLLQGYICGRPMPSSQLGAFRR